jgi:cytochrome c
MMFFSTGLRRRLPSPQPSPAKGVERRPSLDGRCGRGGNSLLPPAGEGGRRSRPDEGLQLPTLLSLAALFALAVPASAGPTSDADRGEALYQACTDCHSIDKNDVGPRHRGVYGRKAGSLPDYAYSDALKSSNIVWNEETLDKWLTDPQALVPGARMFFHLDNPQDRADVIAYLKERAK